MASEQGFEQNLEIQAQHIDQLEIAINQLREGYGVLTEGQEEIEKLLEDFSKKMEDLMNSKMEEIVRMIKGNNTTPFFSGNQLSVSNFTGGSKDEKSLVMEAAEDIDTQVFDKIPERETNEVFEVSKLEGGLLVENCPKVTGTTKSDKEIDDLIKSLINCYSCDGDSVRDNSYSLGKPNLCSRIDEQFNCFLDGRSDNGCLKHKWKQKSCKNQNDLCFTDSLHDCKYAPPFTEFMIDPGGWSFVSGGLSAGSILGLLLALLLIKNYGWESVLYIFGGLGVAWFSVFQLVKDDQPPFRVAYPSWSQFDLDLMKTPLDSFLKELRTSLKEVYGCIMAELLAQCFEQNLTWSILKTGDSEIVINICGGLKQTAIVVCYLSKEDELRDNVLFEGFIPPLLGLFKLKSVEGRLAATKIIYVVYQDEAKDHIGSKVFSTEGVVSNLWERLVKGLKDGNVVVGLLTTRALRNLPSNTEGCWPTTIKADGVDTFVNLLSTGESTFMVDEETKDNWHLFLSQLKIALSTSKMIAFVTGFQRGIREYLSCYIHQVARIALRVQFGGHMETHCKELKIQDSPATILSDLENLCPVQRKRSKVCYINILNASISSLNAFTTYTIISVHEEVKEILKCLIMLFEGVKNWEKVESATVTEAASNHSFAYLGSMKFSKGSGGLECEEADKALSSMVKYIASLPLLHKPSFHYDHSKKTIISIFNCLSKMDLKSIQKFGFDLLVKMALNLLNHKLKPRTGGVDRVHLELPEFDTATQMLLQTSGIIARRMIKRNNVVIPQVFAKWAHLSESGSRWEDYNYPTVSSIRVLGSRLSKRGK